MKIVQKCKHCGNLEFWDEFRWLNGKQLCRNCYKKEYEHTYDKLYRWNDLEGPRPQKGVDYV